MSVQTRDSRVEDYLNDKVQTIRDLGTLDSLMIMLKDQRGTLQKQLTKAENELGEDESISKSQSVNILSSANDFQRKHDIVNQRLNAVTASEDAAEIVSNFKFRLGQLKQLNIAKGYVSILIEVESLRAQARSKIPHDLRGALAPYNQLQTLAHQLKINHEVAEEAAVHLVDFVNATVSSLWEEMKTKLTDQFQATLTKIGWPTTTLPLDNMEEFDSGFYKLLMLQKPDIDSGSSKPILAFEVLVRALALRFRYHFEGDRPTNRADKPEWYLSHLTNVIEEYTPLFTTNIQDILDHYGLSSRDALQEFITALIPILRRKVDFDMPIISSQGALSSHLIQELIKFDTSLKEEYMYAPYGQDPGSWQGITDDILTANNAEFFWKWLTAEKEFALARYDNVITAEDAWTLDYESLEHGLTKPTKSAIRLKDLLETITERYRDLASFSQRLRFLMDIQITILDQYHERLKSSIDAFKMLSSSIGRAVHGTTGQGSDSVSHVAGLERLCRVYGSALYLEEFMRDWGEDIFFLELWDELQNRAQKNTLGLTASAGMTVDDIAGRTSSAILNEEEEGALFDETAGMYKALRNAVEPMMLELILSTMRDSFKPYFKINLWHSTDDSESINAAELSPSSELIPAVKSLSKFVTFLNKALSSTVFQRLVRLIFVHLQILLLDNVVNRNQFSERGGAQFQRDCQELIRTANHVNVDLENTTRRLSETCLLLSFPVIPPAHENDDDVPQMGLGGVREKMFENGNSARKVAGQLNLQTLTVANARELLQRRVENWA